MDHLVYISSEAKELDRLLDGHKTIIVRATDEEKLPFGRITDGDTLYFMTTGRPGVVQARGEVKNVLFRNNLSREECTELLNRFLMEMMLTEDQLSDCDGCSCVILVRVVNIEKTGPFSIEDSIAEDMEDWYIIEDIKKICKNIKHM